MLKLPQTLDAPTGAIFVSPTGANTGMGATAAAPVSITRARELVVQRGGNVTVVLAGGLYRNVEWNTSASKVVLQAAKGETPKLDGTIDVPGPFVASGRAFVANYDNNLGDIFTPGAGKTIPDKRIVSVGKEYAGNYQQVFIGDKFLEQVGSLADIGPGKFFVDFSAKKLHLGDNPGTNKVRATKSYQAIFLGGTGGAIIGLDIFGYAGCGITLGGTNNRIEHCRILYSAYNSVLLNGPGSKLVDSEVGYGGLQCLGGGWYNQTLTVTNNNLHHGNNRQFNLSWAATTLKMLGGNPEVKATDKLVFEDNYVHDSPAPGIWCDVNVHNASIKRNWVENCTIGIFWEISQVAAIEDNYIKNCGNGIQVSCGTDASIRFNTIENCGISVNILDWGRDRGRAEKEHPPGDGWNARRNAIENNLFLGAKTAYLQTNTYQTELGSSYISSFKNCALVTNPKPTQLVTWSTSTTAQEKKYQDLNLFRSENPNYGQNVVLYESADQVPNTVGLRAGVTAGGGYVGTVVTDPEPSTDLEHQTELFELRTENEYLKTTNQSLTDQVTALETQVANLTSQPSNGGTSTTMLQQQVDSLTNQVDILTSQMETAKAKLASVKTILEARVTIVDALAIIG